MDSFLSKYKNWVLRNPADGKKIEEYLRLFSYLVPSLFGLSSSSASSVALKDGTGLASQLYSGATDTPTTLNIVGETLYSCSNLLGLYHDTVLSSSSSPSSSSVSSSSSNNNTNTTAHPGSHSKLESVRWFLSILSSMDVLGEVIATVPWNSTVSFPLRSLYRSRCILTIELVRVMTKLYVLIHAKERIQREGGQMTLPLSSHNQNLTDSSSSSPSAIPSVDSSSSLSSGPQWWRGSLTGIAIPLPEDTYRREQRTTNDTTSSTLSSTESPYQLFLHRLQYGIQLLTSSSTTPSILASSSSNVLHSILSGTVNNHDTNNVYPNGTLSTGIYSKELSESLFLIGEILYILRPLIYHLLQGGYRYPGQPIRQWLPLIISITIDILASQTTRAAAHVANGDSWLRISSLLPFFWLRNTLLGPSNNKGINTTTSSSSSSLLSMDNKQETTITTSMLRSLQETIISSPLIGPYFRGFTNTPSQASEELLFAALTATPSSSPSSSSTVKQHITLQTIRKTAPVLSTLVRLGLWLKEEPPSLSLLENIELHRRSSLFSYYLLRSPLYETITVPLIRKTCGKVSWIPIIGSLALYGQDVLQYMHDHHFCSSASQ